MIKSRVRQFVEKWSSPEVKDRMVTLIDENCATAAFHTDDSFTELLDRI